MLILESIALWHLFTPSADDPYVHINAGWSFLSAGQYDRAIAEARQAPNHTDTQPMLGLAYLGKGKVEKAVEVFEENLRL